MAGKPREVVQCDLSGEEIRSFGSALEASTAMGSKYPSAIHRSIRYGRPSFGFRWKYEGEELKPIPPGTPGKRRRVVSINIATGEEIIHRSISQASRDLVLGLTAIENALQTGSQAKGYRFRYEGEELVKRAKKSPYRRAIVGLGDDDVILKRWPSAYDVAKELGVIDAAVYGCVNSKNPYAKCKGYRLFYEEDFLKKKAE